jgi:hypothetical protein
MLPRLGELIHLGQVTDAELTRRVMSRVEIFVAAGLEWSMSGGREWYVCPVIGTFIAQTAMFTLTQICRGEISVGANPVKRIRTACHGKRETIQTTLVTRARGGTVPGLMLDRIVSEDY